MNMALKVLLLNFPREEILKVPRNISITKATIESMPTLHDFHCILMDVNEIFDKKWWSGEVTSTNAVVSRTCKRSDLDCLDDRINEQIKTGGITFCFSGPLYDKMVYFKVHSGYSTIDNYFFCPTDLRVINEQGDTFYPKFEELRYFTPLIKQIPPKDIEWSCYFSKIPKTARVLGVNRAGYSVFMELSLGAGKLVMLPRFLNRAKAATIIVNEIIPQMVREEEVTFVPQWLPSYSSPFEKRARSSLNEIDKAKRLLFTKDKVLKKTVAFAFEKLGFRVNILPDGTLPDLRIVDGEQKAIVEVKGHENRQANRKNVLQLLGYLSETDVEEKGIVVSNHEFNKEPTKRSEKAFTDGAVKLGKINDISLVSSVSLYRVVMKTLEKKLDNAAMKKMRGKVMAGSGLVQLP